jgi:hypothetical protein
MKLTITPTAEITVIGGVPCRVWEGVTEAGVRCKLFIHRLAVAADQDDAEFQRELLEQLPPATLVDLRYVLP